MYLESQVFEVLRLSYGRIGPTESRLILVVANTALALSTPSTAVAMAANAVFAGLALGMIGMLVARFGANLRRLAHMEPVKGR